MRKPGVSKTRESILKFIPDFIDQRGYSPTVRDIVKGCQLSSTAVVQHHLNVLEKAGFIHRDPEVFRSIQLVEKDTVAVPLLGTVAAGQPIPVPDSNSWTSTPEESLKLPRDLVGGRDNIYALRVKGMSMIDALIADGDIVVMESAQNMEDGEMAAVWLKEEQEVTLKKLYREPGCLRLQPANEQMKPIYVKPENVELQGKVVAVLRKLNR
ncbi:MAG: repressor LexA [Dehalococcoidia bacterium]|nr:repressor LexA [Dehalococcoidia bacterium]